MLKTAYTRWLVFIALVWGIPVFFFWLGAGMHLQNVERNDLTNQFNVLEEKFNDFFNQSQSEEFFQRHLRRYFKDLKKFERSAVASFTQAYFSEFPDNLLEIYLFDGKGGVILGPRPEIHSDLETIFEYIRTPGFNRYFLSENEFPELKKVVPFISMFGRTMRNKPGQWIQIQDNKNLAEDPSWGFWNHDNSSGKDAYGLLVLGFFRHFSHDFCVRSTMRNLAVGEARFGYTDGKGKIHLSGEVPGEVVNRFLILQEEEPQTQLTVGDYLGIFKTEGFSTFFVIELKKPSSRQWFWQAVVLYLALSFLFLVMSYQVIYGVRPIPAGVSGKLLLFFSLGVGFPILVSISLGNFYLREKQEEIIQTTRQDDLQRLQDLDRGFQEIVTQRFLFYKRAGKRLSRATNKEAAIKEFLRRGFDDLLYENYCLISSLSVPITSLLFSDSAEKRAFFRLPKKDREAAFLSWLKNGHIPDYNDVKQAQGFAVAPMDDERKRIPAILQGLAHAGRLAMNIHNSDRGFPPIPVKGKSDLIFSSFIDPGSLSLLKSLYVRSKGLIFVQRQGGDYYFADVISGANGEADYFIFMDHRILTLERSYLRGLFSRTLTAQEDTWTKAVGYQFPYSPQYPHRDESEFFKPLVKRMRRSKQNIMTLHKNFRGHPSEVTVLNCSYLKYFCLFKITSWEKIGKDLRKFRLRVFWCLVGCAFFSFLVMHLFIRQLVVPLRDLTTGMKAMVRKDFQISIPVRSQDELGKLCKVFNEAIIYLRSMEVGSVVQADLLPERKFSLPPFALEGDYEMTQSVGGDYFDFIPLPDGRLATILGDVSGHGLSAALVTAMAKAGFTILCPAFPDRPDEIMNRISRALMGILKKKKMMTCILGILDPADESWYFSNAGQNSPILISADGKASYLAAVSYPLGLKKNPKYEVGKLSPFPRALVLYSDGLVEAQTPSDDVIGYSRFLEIFQTLFQEKNSIEVGEIYKRIRELTVGIPFDDDVTCVVISKRGTRSDGVAWTFGAAQACRDKHP